MDAETLNLLKKGFAAFQSRERSKAAAILNKVLERAPDTADAHHMLARIHFNRGEHDKAERFARRAVTLDGGDVIYQETLVNILRTISKEAALEEYEKAAKTRPRDFGAAYGLGIMLYVLRRREEAVPHFHRACILAPKSVQARAKFARILERMGRWQEALRVIEEALALGGDSADLHGVAGKCLLELNESKQAVVAYEKAMERDEKPLHYHSGLSCAYLRAGRVKDAKRIAARLIERAPSISLVAKKPEASVLVLHALPQGYFIRPYVGPNNYARANTISQVTARRLTVHHLYVDHPDPVTAARALGPIDVIFNNVANAETVVEYGYLPLLRRIIDTLDVPAVNPPEAILRSSRQKNAETIPAIPGVVFPKTERFALEQEELPEIERRIDAEYSYPLLIRKFNSHADETVPLVRDRAELGPILKKMSGTDIYAIEYRTEPYRPGIFRKIRCAFIDKVFFPVRVDFAENWNVHQAQRGLLESNPDLMESEQAFLSDPIGYLGRGNYDALAGIVNLLDLDFLGIDFNLGKDGELIVFEANPVMNVIENRQVRRFPYFAGHWERTLSAFEDMIIARARTHR